MASVHTSSVTSSSRVESDDILLVLAKMSSAQLPRLLVAFLLLAALATTGDGLDASMHATGPITGAPTAPEAAGNPAGIVSEAELGMDPDADLKVDESELPDAERMENEGYDDDDLYGDDAPYDGDEGADIDAVDHMEDDGAEEEYDATHDDGEYFHEEDDALPTSARVASNATLNLMRVSVGSE